MRIPKSLETLADQGVIQEVVRPLMSGKEAQIYLVVSEDYYCAAKIYKDAQNRSFKNKADYVEGRKVRNSRDQRAIAKGTKYGKEKDEDTWKSTEVEMIYRLRDAGVRVPEPYVFIDGVLIMELVVDENDQPAPRLGDLQFTPGEATKIYQHLIHETARMLSAGVVHGDLSDFNVLLAADGPVIIDFPQAVNAASNQNARSLLLRDVNNLHRFLQRWVPGARRLPYAEEMWSLYESNQLTAETRLTGRYKGASGPVDTRAVLSLIGDANRDEARRRQAQGLSTAGLSSGRPASGEPAGPLRETLRPQDDAPSQATVPARRREYIVEKPAPRGRPPQDRARGDRPRSGSAAHDRPSQGSARSGGPSQGGARSDGLNHGGARGDRPRSGGPAQQDRAPFNGRNDARRAPPPKRPGANAMPKRGEGVQASTYVSPEARKAKVKTLTPRDSSSGATSQARRSDNAPRTNQAPRSNQAPRTNQASEENQTPRPSDEHRTGPRDPGRRRRSRGPSPSSGESQRSNSNGGNRPGSASATASAQGGARPQSEASAGGAGRGRRRRPRRSSAE